MSDTKQWLSPTEVEVTKTETKVEVVDINSLVNELVMWRSRAALDLEQIKRLEGQIAELEAIPNRPEAEKPSL